ncbi:MAG: hypothetical protein P8099_13185 [Gemmatimonadota bacterium]|jgi:hypothetical protein
MKRGHQGQEADDPIPTDEGEPAGARPDTPTANSLDLRPPIRPMVWDIALNVAIPLACYRLTKAYVSPSDFNALLAASIFPILRNLVGVVRRRSLDPIAVLVLLGISTGMLAIALGGSAKLLLLRESLFTGVFGLACLVSLVLPRPLMFYFGRFFTAGNDPARRARFDATWQYARARKTHRIITLVWGLLYLGEFTVCAALIYTQPITTVLAVSPLLFGSATILAIIWTFRYARKARERAIRRSGPARSPR